MIIHVTETHWYDDRYASEKKPKNIYGAEEMKNTREEKSDDKSLTEEKDTTLEKSSPETISTKQE